MALGALVVLPLGMVCAQAQGLRATSLTGTVDASVNVVAERRAGTGDTTDTVTELRPGIRLDSRSGRVQGSLSYSLGLSHHSRSTEGQNVRNFLAASFQAEAIERWMYVDATSSITQQSGSAYGQQTVTSAADNANRIEVGSVSISPYVRGVLGQAVSYELRLTGAATNGRRSIAADSTTTGGSLSLSSALPGTVISWGLVASTQTLDFRAGRQTTSDRYSARVGFVADADLSLNLRAGQESTDVGSVIKTRYDNWGAGFVWRPSPRTRAQLDMDERYFGRSHAVVLEHGMPSSSIQFTSSRDAINGADPGGGQRITLYQFLDRALASTYPDPTERDLRIRAILQASNGADPQQLVSAGSINSAVTVFERQQLNFNYAATRLSSTVQFFRNSTRVLDGTPGTVETAPVRQWGYVSTVSYRLTPTAQLSLTGNRMLTQSNDFRSGTELKSLSLGWSDQILRQVSLSVNGRYTVFNSSNTDAYRQAAISASLSQRF